MRICSVSGCERKHRTGGYCDMHRQRVKLNGTPDPGKKAHASLEERFWRRVVKLGDEDCWEWVGGKVAFGHGRIQEAGKGSKWLSTHRLSYEMHHGPIPDGKIVRHRCDNPSCVNPRHLEIGTHKENTADMDARGRRKVVAPLGSQNGKAVLNEDIVRLIRSSDEGHAELARKLGVSPNAVRGVRIGRTWGHVI